MRKEQTMVNNNDEMRKLEDWILNSSIPEDENDSRETTASNIKKKLKRYSQSKGKDSDKNKMLIPIAVIGGTVILCLTVAIVSTLNNSSTPVQRNGLQNTQNEQNTMEGFNYLKETQIEHSENTQEYTAEQLPTQETTKQPTNISYETNTTTEQIGVEKQETSPPPTNNYFLSPAMSSAVPTDSLVQIGDKVFKLPVSLRELEESGVVLITLGQTPPGEEDILHPQMRNGTIQHENKRYRVTLKNGAECTYHDLTVCEITAQEEGSSMYIFNGITIGTEEAFIPQGADRIEQDFAKINTFYYWGNLNKQLYNTTGRCTKVVVSNATGKVVEVSVFDDATVTN